MAISFRGKKLLSEQVLMYCEACKKIFSQDCSYCSECGAKLKPSKTRVYANYSKNGLTSISYVLPNGVTINSKNGMTMSLGNGLSYNTK